MTSRRIDRYRNYSDLLARHDRQIKLKRIFRMFTYFLIILFLLIVLTIVLRWERRQSSGADNQQHSSMSLQENDFNSGVPHRFQG